MMSSGVVATAEADGRHDHGPEHGDERAQPEAGAVARGQGGRLRRARGARADQRGDPDGDAALLGGVQHAAGEAPSRT
jgi:hypothetical protein